MMSAGCARPGMDATADIMRLTLTLTPTQDARGQAWNATAELFINTADNSWLDAYGFVPICMIDSVGMANVRC
jgi:hypothetical protein